ncbi:PLP-dependent transferase [Mollisia scopiformis]|uniref:histidinol-phosphate transaminase n=1 Tax=Mollisia scopiformis TaxID=149040 RepID=A0A194X4C5_MOLSC|nr:PLP-dependent transferase [Mollisia scopiformis]KUJ15026.1 PLP-dependent transferase [Mollisia scopiformis]
MSNLHPFDIAKCARPNILALKPYTTMRDDYSSNADVTLLDANENAFGPSIASELSTSTCGSGVTIQSALDPKELQLHRYPDAQQTPLKQLFCDLRNTSQSPDAAAKPLKPENVCLGVGSDESIDGIIRAFCTPGKDKILIVCVNLDTENGFSLRSSVTNETLSNDPLIKVVFLCSPQNPTGNLLLRPDIVQVILAAEVNAWPNLIVTSTLSKAFGFAAIRLGVTFSQPQISQLLNNLKGPYNMSAPTIALATLALQPEGIALMKENRVRMFEQRARLLQELPKIPGFGKFLGGFNTNFILVQFLSKPADQGGIPDNVIAQALLHALVTKSRILVRYRGKEAGCVGSLRITKGTGEEVDTILLQIRTALEEAYAREFPMP